MAAPARCHLCLALTDDRAAGLCARCVRGGAVIRWDAYRTEQRAGRTVHARAFSPAGTLATLVDDLAASDAGTVHRARVTVCRGRWVEDRLTRLTPGRALAEGASVCARCRHALGVPEAVVRWELAQTDDTLDPEPPIPAPVPEPPDPPRLNARTRPPAATLRSLRTLDVPCRLASCRAAAGQRCTGEHGRRGSYHQAREVDAALARRQLAASAPQPAADVVDDRARGADHPPA